MSGRKRNNLAPTLFPFLAVLVCTLGTLILLLALVAQEAKTTAQQQAEQAKTEAVVANRLTSHAVTDMIEEEQLRADFLVSIRDQQTADLERRRDELTHTEAELDKLKKRLQALRTEVESTSLENESTINQDTLVMLKDELKAEEAKVAQLAEDVTGDQPRVIIVPHKGPNGTDRRPVYLECTADGVKVWPEGVTITPVQLLETIPDANPLDAALRVVRYHAMQNYGDKVAPYPMLVVRPDGTETYAMARAAMKDWDDQFGYELVPGEVELAFPSPDDELRNRLEVAVRHAAMKQRSLVAAMSGYGTSGYGRNPNGTSLDGRGDASDPNGRPGGGRATSSRRPRTLSAAELDREAKSNGFKPVDRFEGGVFDDRTDFDRMIDTMPKQVRKLTDTNGRLAGSPSAPTGNAESVNTTNNGGEDVETLPRQIPGPASAFSLPGESTDQAPQVPSNDPPSLTVGDWAVGDWAGSDQQASDQPRSSAATRRTDGSSTQSNPTAQAAPGASASSPARPSMDLTSPENDPDEMPQRMPSTVKANLSPQKAKSMVRRQGRDWAIPDSIAGMNGTEVVRTLRAKCYYDRIVLVGSNNSGIPVSDQTFRFPGGRTDQATLEFATAVRDRIETWGTSLPGGRWQPRLEVEVMTQAEQRFSQLRAFMMGSGIDVQGVPARSDQSTGVQP